jgi:hypothetical protein
MFIIYTRTNYLYPVALKLKSKDFCLAGMLFYILQKNYLSKSSILFEDLWRHVNLEPDIKYNIVGFTSQFGMYAILLVTVGK